MTRSLEIYHVCRLVLAKVHHRGLNLEIPGCSAIKIMHWVRINKLELLLNTYRGKPNVSFHLDRLGRGIYSLSVYCLIRIKTTFLLRDASIEAESPKYEMILEQATVLSALFKVNLQALDPESGR